MRKKNNFSSKFMIGLFVLFVSLFSFVSIQNANAGMFDGVKHVYKKTKKKIKKTAKKVKKGVSKVKDKVKDTAKKGYNKAKDTAKKGYNKAKDAAGKVKDKTEEYFNKGKKVVVKGSSITMKEMNKIKDKTKKVYKSGIKLVKKGYDATLKAFNKVKDKVLVNLYKKACKKAIEKNKAFINKIRYNMNHLSKKGRKAMDRIIRNLPKKNITKQMRDDMNLLGKELGFVSGSSVKHSSHHSSKKIKEALMKKHLPFGMNKMMKKSHKTVGASKMSRTPNKKLMVSKSESPKMVTSSKPNKVKRSSWGIYVSAGAGLIAGGEVNVAVVMNTFKDHGKYPVGIAVGGAGSVGLEGGGDAQVGVFWAPGTIDDTDGVSVGIGAEATLGVGAAVGVSWSVDKDLFKEAINGVPGFNIGLSAGVEANAGSISIGYTKLVKEFK